ncbi:MAG: hypothetical protein ACREPS_06225 [Rhodanobacteraceae bacterium]
MQIYSGQIPATPEIGINGAGITNTLLATFTFAATAFASPQFNPLGYLNAPATLVANPVTPVAPGTAVFARILKSGGNPNGGQYSGGIEDRIIGQTWQAGLHVSFGQYIMSGANTYVCTTAGVTATAPTSLDANISDGTAFWQYWAPGAPDILLTNSIISTSVPLTIPWFWLGMPCK